MFDNLSRELELKDDVIPNLGIKVLHEIEKCLGKLAEEFNGQFSNVTTATALEQEIHKRMAFFEKIFNDDHDSKT